MLLNTIWESAVQALGQLWANKLRSVLSLLGITIGVWCVIAVQAAINSLESNIRGGFETLGNDVVYVSKQPWGEDPGENFWKYQRRPNPGYTDFQAVRNRVKTYSLASMAVFIGFKTVEYHSSNVGNVFLIGGTYDYGELAGMEFAKGRWVSPTEYHYGTDVIVLGYKVADKLFSVGEDPLGKRIKVDGRYMTVIGVLKQAGKALINPFDFDNDIIIGYNTSRKFLNMRTNFGALLSVKSKKDIPLAQLKDDLRGVLRAQRKLKPREEDNFALNGLSIISSLFDNIFRTFNAVGLFIGLFSLLVGMFGVANIMFVSVNERTNIIGIKKALGAKRLVILLEFLIEAIVLCVLGGAIGLFLVWGATVAASSIFGYDIFLSYSNIMIGVSIAVGTGVLAGIIPAWRAANLDPVEAMRR